MFVENYNMKHSTYLTNYIIQSMIQAATDVEVCMENFRDHSGDICAEISDGSSTLHLRFDSQNFNSMNPKIESGYISFMDEDFSLSAFQIKKIELSERIMKELYKFYHTGSPWSSINQSNELIQIPL